MSIARTTGVLCGAATILLLLASPARASINYVQNGGFETTTNGTGELTFNTVATGWTSEPNGGNDGYNFLFAPGTADTTGATGADGSLKLWGPNDGSNNGLPATSPDGGNYVAMDGAYEVGALQQTISTALTVGDKYIVGFWWAGAQQSGFTGVNTEGFQVSMTGDATQDTNIVSNVSEGFTGWTYQQFTFVATTANPVLSFLAVGTPNGEPPFSLLDGVSLQAVPEPATCALIGLGLLAVPLAAAIRRKRR
ncbi:MAG TPA: PEP-CTERM sorting domain-containing protein [Bryobacteraceae bacterium]|nr:PEP-CTERM sorting domain-containing protein [Bryobacteraceae bacterium]